MTDRFHIITGGPGAGKTSLVAALAAAGWNHMAEGGRAIIQEQVASGGNALPWADRAAFADRMLAWDLRSYRAAMTRPGPVIFDRGIPDVIGYRDLCGLPIPDKLARAAQTRRYARHVFIAPYWPAIFAQDAERKQDLAEALATHDAMVRTYSALGYILVPLPRATVKERVDFVLAHLRAATPGL